MERPAPCATFCRGSTGARHVPAAMVASACAPPGARGHASCGGVSIPRPSATSQRAYVCALTGFAGARISRIRGLASRAQSHQPASKQSN